MEALAKCFPCCLPAQTPPALAPMATMQSATPSQKSGPSTQPTANGHGQTGPTAPTGEAGAKRHSKVGARRDSEAVKANPRASKAMPRRPSQLAGGDTSVAPGERPSPAAASADDAGTSADEDYEDYVETDEEGGDDAGTSDFAARAIAAKGAALAARGVNVKNKRGQSIVVGSHEAAAVKAKRTPAGGGKGGASSSSGAGGGSSSASPSRASVIGQAVGMLSGRAFGSRTPAHEGGTKGAQQRAGRGASGGTQYTPPSPQPTLSPPRPTEANEANDALAAAGYAHSPWRVGAWRPAEGLAARPAWDGSPMRYIPAALKGLRPATREPWSTDEELYHKALDRRPSRADGSDDTARRLVSDSKHFLYRMRWSEKYVRSAR